MKNARKQVLLLSLIVSLVGFGTLILSGCSGSSGTSNVQIQFPDWSAHRAADIARRSQYMSLMSTSGQVSIIAINVTGTGISPAQTFYWQRNASTDTPPTSASFSIPQGSGRLFQVLAVYGDGQTEFYYGENTQSVSGDTSVDINLASVASANSGVQGKIIGRYLNADQTGPTGVYQYRFAPPSGSATMVVTTGEAFAGWVNLFALDTPLIQYTWADGTAAFTIKDLAGNDVQPNDASLLFFRAATVGGIARVEVPANYIDQNNSGTVANLQPQSAQRYVFGFFGPGAALAPRKLCYNPLGGSAIQQVYQTQNFNNPLRWSPSTEIPAVSLLDTNGASTTGTPYTGCQTSSDLPYITDLYLDETRLTQDQNSLGINGPFQAFADGNYLSTSYNAATQVLTVNWNLLPGVAAATPTFGVFYRSVGSSNSTNNDADLQSQNGFDCGRLASLDNPLAVVTASAANSSATISNVSFGTGGATSSFAEEVIVCPFNSATGTYFTSAAATTVNASNFNPTVVLASVADLKNNTIVGGACAPYRAMIIDQNFRLSPIATAIAAQFTMSGGISSAPSFYADANCETTPQSTIGAAIAAGASASGLFYIKGSASGYGQETVTTLVTSGNGVGNGNAFLYFPQQTSSVPTHLSIASAGETYLIQGQCSSFAVKQFDTNSFPSTAATATTVSLSNSDGLFYTNNNCSGMPVTSVSLPANRAAVEFFYKLVAVDGTSTALQASASGLAPASDTVPVGSDVIQSYEFSFPGYTSGNFQSGTQPCIPFYVTALDEHAYATPSNFNRSLTLTNSNGAFYTDGTCTSTLSGLPSASTAGGTSSAVIALCQGSNQSNQYYFKPNAAATGITFTANDSLATGSAGLTAATYGMVCPLSASIGGADYLAQSGVANIFYANAIQGGTLNSLTLMVKTVSSSFTQSFAVAVYACGTSGTLGNFIGTGAVGATPLNSSTYSTITFMFPALQLPDCGGGLHNVGFLLQNSWSGDVLAAAVTTANAACFLDEGASTTGFESYGVNNAGVAHDWVSTIGVSQ